MQARYFLRPLCPASAKKSTIRSVYPHSPCVLDVPGAYNVNSCSGCVHSGSFRREVKGQWPMRPDGKWRVRTSVVHLPARAESRPGLEPSPDLDSSRQETAKTPPRGSSLESSRQEDPCPSRLEPPRDSSPLVDPCSSHQETGCQETRASSARGTPGFEGLESAGLVHNTSPEVLDAALFAS